MKRFLGIACILFSGYASAQVAHPENTNIVGVIEASGSAVCFEDDGSVDANTCAIGATNADGAVYLSGLDWGSGALDYAIIGCGTAAVDPVSNAACYGHPSGGVLASCVNDGYILVQTQSGYYFAVKANADCTLIATPETTGIVACLSTDAFDPLKGCFAMGSNPSQISVESGYMKLDRWGSSPPASHCAEAAHDGRMAVDSVNSELYICTQAGWSKTQLITPL